jgi:SHS2 domain-containing protein
MKRYKLIDHTADIGIAAFGKDLPEAFANAAYAMFDILTDVSKVDGKNSFELQVSARNQEELLVTWLDELLFRYETERIVCDRFVINSLDDNNLSATIFYEKIDLKKHEIKTEIKNVTYHQLKIEKTHNGWSAQVIFDL